MTLLLLLAVLTAAPKADAKPADAKADAKSSTDAKAPAPKTDTKPKTDPPAYVITKDSRTLEQIDKLAEGLSPLKYEPPTGRLTRLPRTAKTLTEKGTLRVVMLGDSIINDTSRSAWNLLVERAYGGAKIVKFTCVRGSTGCWWYKEPGRVKQYVLDLEPDLLIIGGISQRDDIDSIRDVLAQVKAGGGERAPEGFLMTGPFGRLDPSDAEQWKTVTDPPESAYAVRLRKLADEVGAEFLDLQRAWGEAVRDSGKPVTDFKRDAVHANPLGEQMLARILERYFAPAK